MLMEGHSKDLGQFPIKVVNRKGDILINYMEPVSCNTTVHDFKLKFIKDTNSVRITIFNDDYRNLDLKGSCLS